jgi:hypothetical protein
MRALPPSALCEVILDTPFLLSVPDFAGTDHRYIGPRESEGCFDFGDMRTVGKEVCVGGDESYKGVFLGRHLRFGYVVGVIADQARPAKVDGYKFINGEAFATMEEMHCRWVLE